MATITLKYAEHTDLKTLVPYVSEFDTKQPIYNWVTTDVSNFYKSYNTGKIDTVFFDGIEGTAVTDDPNADYEFRYSEGNDSVEVFLSTANPNDILIESGQDWSTLVTSSLVNATMELNSMLDSRFPIPIPKTLQYSNSVASDTPEYDFVIKKLTCYIAGINLIRATNPQDERADALQEQVDSIIEKINSGNLKLRFEVDAQDKSGEIIVGPSNAGTMYLVESYCEEWIGEPYDKVEIECTTTGVYGVAKISVKMFGGQKLSGSTVLTNHVVSGGLQEIGNGLWLRFEGNSMTDGDKWFVPIRQRSLLTTNTQVTSIRAIRK